MNQPQQTSSQPKGGSLKWLLIILGIIVVLGGGYLLYAKYGKSLTTATTTTSPTATTSSPAITTATPTTTTSNKIIYTNSKYGFSFELPKDYVVFETGIAEGAEGVELKIGKKINEVSSETTWIKLIYYKNNSAYDELVADFDKNNGDISKKSETQVDNQKAAKYSVGGFASGFTVLSAKGKEDIEISVYPDSESNIKIFDQIVSTFQFNQ